MHVYNIHYITYIGIHTYTHINGEKGPREMSCSFSFLYVILRYIAMLT